MQNKTKFFPLLTLLLLLCQLITSPLQAASSTKDITIVMFDGGSFEMIGNKQWVEKNRNNQITFRFIEQNRTEISILLFDASRNVHLALIIADQEILYSHKGEEFRKIYTITAAHTNQRQPKQQIKCGKNYEWRHNQCILKQNCGKNAHRNPEGDCFCKENYELKNGKCEWKTDKNGFEIAPWKKPECKELQRLCDRGVDKACMQYEGICQVN